MTTSKNARLRIGAALLLIVLLIAPPLGIAALVGRPYPEWSVLRQEIEVGQVSADTVMRIAAVLFIGIWLWLVVTIGAETFRVINATRHEPRAVRRLTVELSAGSSTGALQRLVRLALLGTVTTAATVSSWSSAVVATSPTLSSLTRTPDPITAPANAADEVPSGPTTTTIVADGRSTPLSVAVDLGDETLRDDIVAMNRSSEWSSGVFPAGMLITVPLVENAPETLAADREYVVRPNDGMWNVADALLGDGARHHELRKLVEGQKVAPGVVFTSDTDTIHPGWTFRLPEQAPAAQHIATVERGDTLSKIAEEQLGDGDRWTDLWELNQGQRMVDGRTFDDPNLILPGWQLRIKPPSTIDDEPTVIEPPAQETPQPVEVAEPTADEPVPPPRSSAEPAGIPVVETAVPEVPSVPAKPATLPPPSVQPAERSNDISADAESESVWSVGQRSVWPELAVGSLLIAGLAETIRRLRLRRLSRLTPGHRLVEPSGVVAGTEYAIARADALPICSTIHGLLRSLTPYAAEQADPPAVRAVQLGRERIEVLFSKPAPMPPHGWTTIDGGHSWTHRIDEPTDESRQLLTPALATIGVRDDESGDEVLLDLETAGSVSVTGDREAVLGLARSVALELGTYPLGVSMDVCLIGLHVDGAELCDRVWLDTTMTRAVRVATQRLERSAGADATNIVGARADLDEDDGAHDPQVFIVDSEHLDVDDLTLVDELVRLCQPSTGLAVVVLGDRTDTVERIVIDADGAAQWSGVSLRTPDVSRQAAGEVAVMLDHVANAESEPIEPVELIGADLSPVKVDTDADEPDVENDGSEVEESDAPGHGVGDEFVDPVYEPPRHDVVVQVMGNVQTHGADLTADETELLALLTCLRHRTEIHIGLVHESIAPDRKKKTIENRVSRLRSRLGVGSDGNDLLPESSSGRNGRSHYMVSPLVVTDVDLLEHRYHVADTLSSADALDVMRDGLSLMEGPLFRARKGFDGWPQSEGVVVAMTAIVQSYATRLIELAVDVDDIALVIRTTATAGRVLDNPLSEFPMRQAEQAYAEACGDSELLASVEGARQRLIEYIDADDAFADA